MTAYITGMGSWLPATLRENHAWSESFRARGAQQGDRTFNDIPAPLDALSAAILERHLAREAQDPMLGSVRRYVADPAQSSIDAEAAAGRAALQMAGVDAAEVDLVLSHAMVPERLIPNAPAVAHAIGALRATALSVDSVCASALSQLEVARAYLLAGMARHVLITQSHLMLRSFPMEHPAAPGLGDAASALLVSAEPSTRGTNLAIRSTFGRSDGAHALSVTWVRGNSDESDPAWWRAGGDLRLGSRRPEGAKLLMRETVSFAAEAIGEAALRAGVDVERIRVLVSVQPRGFIPGAIAERLGLPTMAAVTTYEQIAHVGACGPVFNLIEAQRRGLLEPGALVALYAQGAGFTRGAALLEITKSAST